MQDIRPVKSPEDHRAALARIDALMDAEAGTPEVVELEVLAILVEKYEMDMIKLHADGLTVPADWLPREQFEIDGGSEVIGWLSSDKGFEDMTARLLYRDGAWYWADDEELVKRPDLIHGVMPWPEPPTD